MGVQEGDDRWGYLPLSEAISCRIARYNDAFLGGQTFYRFQGESGSELALIHNTLRENQSDAAINIGL